MATGFGIALSALAFAAVAAIETGRSGSVGDGQSVSPARQWNRAGSQRSPSPPPDANPAFEGSFAESGPSTYLVPLLPPASNAMGQQGFVRVINRSDERGHVRIDAYDDTGQHRGRVFLGINANATAHFNSNDLEDGNPNKGLARGVGPGEGFWRLRLFAELNVEVLAYMRTEDGFLTSMHDVLPSVGSALRAGIFNPGRNINQVSKLRLINLGDEEATVRIRGTDDKGESPGEPVELAIPAGASQILSADALESGHGLTGGLGEGAGKWRLLVEPEGLVVGMNLLESPTGHLTNLSTGPVQPYESPNRAGLYLHSVPHFPATSDLLGRQGFVRVVNRETGNARVFIDCFDGSGTRYFGAIELDLATGQTVNFNSDDLESGNPDKGLRQGIGPGPGSWRLMLQSWDSIDVYSYIRTRDGFLTSMQDFVPRSGGRHHVAILNPGSNDEQVSRLRIVNPEFEVAKVLIRGIDGGGTRSTSPSLPSQVRFEPCGVEFAVILRAFPA